MLSIWTSTTCHLGFTVLIQKAHFTPQHGMKTVWGRGYFVRKINFLLPLATNIPCHTPEAAGDPGGQTSGTEPVCFALSWEHKKVVSSMDALRSSSLQTRQVPMQPAAWGLTQQYAGTGKAESVPGGTKKP